MTGFTKRIVRRVRRTSREDFIFHTCNFLIMALIIVVTLYPFLHVCAISLNDARDAMQGGIGIFPRKFSLDSYRTVFGYENLYNAFLISVSRSFLGTVLSLFVTTLCAYAMTKKRLPGYKFIYHYFIVAMFVGGGLIPSFLLYKQLGLYNTFWIYIIPGAFSTYYMILFRTYIIQLPGEMEESAYLDGANEIQVFFKIILPLCTPILATIGLFVAVSQWNSWQDTLYFVLDKNLEPLQYVLMKVLSQTEAARITKQAKSMMMRHTNTVSITPDSIKMAITMVATFPIICVYPFLQKYFVKGMVIGAVKG